MTVADLRALAALSMSIEAERRRLAGELLAAGETAADVASALGVSRGQLYKLIGRGEVAKPERSRATESAERTLDGS
jgi:transposase-like protein